MNQASILLPMAALAMWTLSVMALIPYQRFKAVFSKQIGPDDFKFGESLNVPPEVSIPNRNYMNLLEIPILFYVACLSAFATGGAEPLILGLAWTYVGLRVLHSVIHLSYNNVIHRLAAFSLSTFVLLAIWINLFMRFIGLGNS
jgi:hypothetical protein